MINKFLGMLPFAMLGCLIMILPAWSESQPFIANYRLKSYIVNQTPVTKVRVLYDGQQKLRIEAPKATQVFSTATGKETVDMSILLITLNKNEVYALNEMHKTALTLPQFIMWYPGTDQCPIILNEQMALKQKFESKGNHVWLRRTSWDTTEITFDNSGRYPVMEKWACIMTNSMHQATLDLVDVSLENPDPALFILPANYAIRH
jgi:hypothetical protein